MPRSKVADTVRYGSLLARLPDYATTNKYFTFACAALPATLGSAVSFLFHGGAIWCAITIASGNQRLSRDRPMLMMAAALYAFVAIGTLSTFLNGGRNYGWALASGLAFLAFPFSYSIWKISNKAEIATAAIFGSALSCVGAAIFGGAQYFFMGIRAEGGAGNSIVFATAVALAMTIVLAGHFHAERKWRPLLSCAYAAGFVALIFSEVADGLVHRRAGQRGDSLVCRRDALTKRLAPTMAMSTRSVSSHAR